MMGLLKLKKHCRFANLDKRKFETRFVESVGAQNNDTGAHPQTLLTEVELRVQCRLQLSLLGFEIFLSDI